MPQLDVATFPSQIFWVLCGFFLVYTFVYYVVTPRTAEILENRVTHIDNILKKANQLKLEANALEQDSSAALEKAMSDIANVELELISNFREQGEKEKGSIHMLFSDKFKKEQAVISKSSDDAFVSVSNDIDDILNVAMNSISCSLRKKS